MIGGMDRKRVTDQAILDAYEATGSVHRAGELLGIGGGSVHERLVLLAANRPVRVLSDADKLVIEGLYADGFKAGDGRLRAVADRLGRTVAFVCRFARTRGLTNPGRKKDAGLAADQGKHIAALWAAGQHPRGMLGKVHSAATKERIGQASSASFAALTDDAKADRTRASLQTRIARYGTLAPPRPHGSWKAAWRDIGGQRAYFRSKWEANYARWLEFQRAHGAITSWEHEPETFWFPVRRGNVSYLPDFRVRFPDGRVEYHEVKGWMDDRSRVKLARMAKYHPQVVVRVLDGTWFKANSRQLRALVPDWE